jgi:PadR family transcriptional regulator, regulatory protein PadR
MCNGGHGHRSCHYSGGGLIQLLILRILHEKPSHGYQIMEELEKITAEKYIPETGSVYTILRRMDERGVVTSEWEKNETGADRRVYTVTEAGVKVLKERMEMVKRRSQLMESLVQYYDTHFMEKEERKA